MISPLATQYHYTVEQLAPVRLMAAITHQENKLAPSVQHKPQPYFFVPIP